MAKHAKTLPHEAAHDDSAKPPSADRRRWLKAGLSAPPILMTVASRPVLAKACVPPSAYVSLGASAPGMYEECLGFGPQAWLKENQWPGTYNRGSTRFNECFQSHIQVDVAYNGNGSVFTSNPFAEISASNNGPKLSEILGYEPIAGVALTDDQRNVARYVTAALLNYASTKVPGSVLGAMTIQHIWTEFGQTGSFVPTRGASPWSAAEIVDYLKSTMTRL